MDRALCSSISAIAQVEYCQSQLAPRPDVVIVADKNTLRGDYRFALVKDVFPRKDGKVHKVTVQYKSYRTGERVHEYRDARDTAVSRAV